MQQTRKALTILGGALLMSVLLGVAATAFSAAVEPAFLENPAAIVVGFSGAADAQAASVAPIVTGAGFAGTTAARPAPVARTKAISPILPVPVRRP